MWDLAEALSRFNRTEPDLLFRDAFGHAESRLKLASNFRERIEETAGLTDIPKGAWWATEYSFNSLAGALLLYAEGESAIERATPNRVKESLRALAENGREDVDFVVSYDNVLILIEAKAYTSYKNKQMASKLARLKLVYDFYMALPDSREPRVSFHFLLTSPKTPQKLEAEWPSWACKGGKRPPWMPMQNTIPQEGVLRVTRCDEKGKTTSKGNALIAKPVAICDAARLRVGEVGHGFIDIRDLVRWHSAPGRVAASFCVAGACAGGG